MYVFPTFKRNLLFHFEDISLRYEEAESLEKFYRPEVVLLELEYFLGGWGGQVELMCMSGMMRQRLGRGRGADLLEYF